MNGRSLCNGGAAPYFLINIKDLMCPMYSMWAEWTKHPITVVCMTRKATDLEEQPKMGDQEDQHAHDRRGPRSAELPAPDVWYYADQTGRVGPLSL